MLIRFAALTSLLALACAVPATTSAQAPTVEGAERDPAVVIVRQILDGGDYLYVDRDTTLGPETVVRNLVIRDARVALEGRVEGGVAVLGADFFMRPRSFVGGAIAVIGGGAYPSQRAQTGPIIELDRRVSIAVDVAGPVPRIILTPPPRPGVIRFPTFFGVGLPTYDRVDGLSMRWSGGLGFGGDTATVALLGMAAYRVERREIHGGVSLLYRPTPRVYLSARASRATRTNENWVRGDFVNSAAAVVFRSDARDYFESDEAAVAVGVAPPPPLIPGEGFVAPRLLVRISRDRSLPAGDPWTLLDRDEPWRPNPLVDDGILASLALAADMGWRGPTTRFFGTAGIEWSPGRVGDFEFAQVTASASWWNRAIFSHDLFVEGHLRFPIGGQDVPRQRWSFVGGPGTLPALPVALMRGDHVLFLSSAYVAPVPLYRFRILGWPALRLEHAVGGAWRSGDARPLLAQNVGAGLQFRIFHAMIHVDPSARPLQPAYGVGAQFAPRLLLPHF